jgi:hypothetical protein
MPIDHRAKLATIKRFDQLIAYLRDDMGWPIARDSFEDVDDLFYDFSADELGIDPRTAAKIQEIKRLRPLSARQPWGIFFVKFEPKKLPVVALRRILSQVALKKRPSANNAERAAWAADDLLFVSNYGEGEERQISFAHFARAQDGHDLPTLKVLGWDNLDTALHLDAVARELSQHLAWPEDDDNAEAWRARWRAAFSLRHREVVTTSKQLSIRLAVLARNIRDRIKTALAIETDKGPLTKLMKAFQTALVHDLDADGFADMYAQTIAYGLLSARIADPHKKTADDFAAHMRTNPFLRELMQTFLKVGGRRGKAGGPGIDFDELGVSEVVELLDDANMEAVVRDFGDRNPQEDPVIHFYELFLKEYDAKKRMQRGVFYTPRPVVSYIVRSVDKLLRTEFGLADGLADTTTWGEMVKGHKDLTIPEGVSPEQDFVQILDPATGTGTFLVEVIDLIYKSLVAKWKMQGQSEKKIDGLWNQYVPKHLLTRLHGYELLMAPYTIAHLKIGLKLYETGYRFGSDERARVYLTNALEPAGQRQLSINFLPALAHEAQAVNEIKRKHRFTVVIGNPPYSNFGQLNRIPFILELLDDYKRGLNERKLNLDDDFIKFIRFAQWLLNGTNVGLLGFISNNTYIDGITHRQMRRSLTEFFTAIDVLDLHGSVVKADRGPDGEREENVFDIKQGVAVGLFARLAARREHSTRHAEAWGTRVTKYAVLTNHSAQDISWRQVTCEDPGYFFVPKKFDGGAEYQAFVSLPKLMQRGTSAIQTKRDAFFVEFDEHVLAERMKAVLKNGPTHQMLERYPLAESAGWSPECLRGVTFDPKRIRRYLYRPFDWRFVYYDDAVLGRSRIAVFRHLLKPNLALATLRQTVDDAFRHVFCTAHLCDINLTIGHHVSDQVFPLYLYADAQRDLVERERVSNISSLLSARLASDVGLTWVDDGPGDLFQTVGPEDVFHYVYAILYCHSYRTRYAEFLKIDFPRLPLTGDLRLFRTLIRLGRELVALHLLESPKLNKSLTEFIGGPSAEVKKVSWAKNTVWIDKAQTTGFNGVREDVWNFHIGGYQVCEKWLRDRKGRTLSEDDIAHYQKIVVALAETIRLMKEIDEVIEQHGGWPGAFQTATAGSEALALHRGDVQALRPAAANDLKSEALSPPDLFGKAADAAGEYDRSKGVGQPPDGPGADAADRGELMIAIRRLFSDGLSRDRLATIDGVAEVLGHTDSAEARRDVLDDSIRTAVRRGILKNLGGELSLEARSIEDYERSFLKEQFLAALTGRTWIERDEAVRRFARWMGFARTGSSIVDTARSLINGLLREERLEASGTTIRRR